MCPEHRKRQVALLRDEFYAFVGWVAVLAGVGLLLRGSAGPVQWLPSGALAVAGAVALVVLHRRRMRRARQLEHDSRSCRACRALP